MTLFDSLMMLLNTDCGKPGHVLVIPPAIRDSMPNDERMRVAEYAKEKGVMLRVERMIDKAMILDKDYYMRWREWKIEQSESAAN